MIPETIQELQNQFNSYSDTSKIWVYYSDLSFAEHSEEINKLVSEFTHSWTSHGAEVKASGAVFQERIILLLADESQSQVSGCSTDSSVRFIKTLETKYQLNFFSRDMLFSLMENKVVSIDLSTILALDKNTLVFNPFFKDLKEWKESFVQPLAESKYKRLL